MTHFPLGWQSWSPPHPNIFRLPPRDYCPVPETHRPLLNTSLPNTPQPPITYWCSWYALGKQLSYSKIINQVHLIQKYQLPLQYILIDDGWQLSHRWLRPLISTIHQLQLKVGIWLAPYTQHKHLSTPTIIDTLVKQYQIDMLKLDFLYKPYFQPGLVNDTQPYQQLTTLFTYIKTNYPHIYTLACGAPFAPALGRVDAIRISKDSTFPPPIPNFIRQPFYIHRINLLHTKSHLIPSSFPANPDPDVRMFALDTPTTSHQWQTITSIPNMLRGLGDNLAQLTEKQIFQIQQWLQH